MGILWSPSDGHFYHSDINAGGIPADAVRITNKRHRDLIDGRAAGRAVVAGRGGKPELGPESRPTVVDLRQQATASVKAEARRRILAIATLERQANDNAAIAVATFNGGPSTVSAELARRRRIDAVRAASAELKATIAASSFAAISTFNAADAALWPVEDS